jgi:hypothetical protein
MARSAHLCRMKFMTTFEPSSCIDPATNQLRWNSSYVGIPRPLLRHPSFASLKGNAVKLLLAMDSGYVGNNNGELIATFPVMKTYGFNSKDAIANALSELLQAGMIIRTRRSDYKRAATYAVTWRPVNKPGTRGPYDAGVSPSDVAEDRWRLPTAHAAVVASARTPSASARGPAVAGPSAPAPISVALNVATLADDPLDGSAPTHYSSTSAMEQKQPPSSRTPPDVSSPRARWPEIKARWDARLAAEKRCQADLAAARNASRSDIAEETLFEQLAA